MSKNSSKNRSSSRVHIISREDGWAIKNARKLIEQGHDVIVHKKDGSIQKWEKGKKG